ncbi:MAG TPA: hypothetical protein VMZ53_00695 [Kofleriaceae bacterium]|nr:hypothetical protein [Kofleriaceae bacterium]
MRRVLLVVVVGACRFNFDNQSATGDAGDAPMVDVLPPADFVPNWQNGSRIRAIVFRAVEGGDPHWFNWRDTQLDSDCYFGIGADGVERCLPYFASAETFYSDAACTQPLIYVANNACDRHIKYADDIVGSRHHIYPINGIYVGQAYDIRTGCSPATTPGGTLYNAGAEVNPTMFEPVIYHTEIVGDFERTFQGFSDGAAIEIGNLNFNIGSCYPYGGFLGSSRCSQSVQFIAEPVYTDAACTQRAYLAQTSTTYFSVRAAEVCGASYSLYVTTADVTQASYFRRTPSGCQMTTTPAGSVLLQGSPTTNPYPTGTNIVGPDRGRLGTLYWVGPDGSAMILGTWDQQLDRPCRPFVAADGKMRCLPSATPRSLAWANASCSNTQDNLAVECFPGIAPLDGPSYRSCEDTPWSVRTLAKVTDTPSIANEAACVSLSTPAYDPAVPVATLSPSMFPELTFTVE